MPYFVLVIIFSVLLLPAFVGVFLPIIPSVPWMFVVALIFGITDRFQHLRWWELLIFGVLALISFLSDNLSGLVGAKKTGASKWGLLAGFAGGLIGLFFLPPFGAIAGMIIGVILAEVLVNRDQQKAVRSASGVIAGNLASIIINLALCFIFLGLFILFSLS